MKIKKVNRYYCDYCKKSGCNKYWIRKHEERCTLNLNRYCGFCHLLDKEQSDLAKAIQLLPDPNKFEDWDEAGNIFFNPAFYKAIDEAMPKLKNFVKNCPACIMASVRQRGIPVYMATGFDFKKECDAIWAEINAENLNRERMEEY